MVGRKLWLTDLTVPRFKMEAASRALKKLEAEGYIQQRR
jgi:hypothetical protein